MNMNRLILTLLCGALLVGGTACSGDDPQPSDKPQPENPGGTDTPDIPGLPTYPKPDRSQIAAFPGAHGAGRYVKGGAEGKVYVVTSLKDDGSEGTLRWAVRKKGPRTIVFAVSGIIELTEPLKINNGDLTIAGQTAPGDGICLKNYTLGISADNVIIRFIRSRMGADIRQKGDDAMNGFHGHRGILIDHCSMSWSTDECATFYNNSNLTLQWCLISESLVHSIHEKGAHGYGGIWGGAPATFHHNLLAHHESRVPRLGPRPGTQKDELVDMRCNVFYNWAGNGCYGGEGMHINIVNNYYKPGPATPKDRPIAHRIFAPGIRTTKYCHGKNGNPNSWAPMEHVWGKFYVTGNVVEDDPETTADNWTRGIYEQVNGKANDGLWDEAVRDSIRLRSPLPHEEVTTHTAQEAFRLVLAGAGCSKRRDTIDSRIVEETLTGTATYIGSVTPNASTRRGLIDLPSDVGGYPSLTATTEEIMALRDTDGDGMPDTWEQTHGLDPHNAADGRASTLNSAGYTNLEVYLDEAAQPHEARRM